MLITKSRKTSIITSAEVPLFCITSSTWLHLLVLLGYPLWSDICFEFCDSCFMDSSTFLCFYFQVFYESSLFFNFSFRQYLLCSHLFSGSDNSVYWKLVFSSDALSYRVIFDKFTHNEHLGLPSVFPSLDSSFFTARLCVQGTAV